MSEEQQDTVEESTVETNDTGINELENLKEEIFQLKNSQSQLIAALKQPKEEKKLPDANQLAALGKDPAALAAWLQQQTEESKKEIRRESQKEIYDRKAYEDFPVLKTDKVFQAEVQKQMKEFVGTGEYRPEDPMLIYRAAQIVAGKVKSTETKKQSTGTQLTSEAPGVRSKTVTSSQTKVSDTDPRVVFAKALGFEGKRLEAFKADLVTNYGTYVAPVSKQKGRMLKK